MPETSSEKFKEFWRKTEVIREYQRSLYTFGDAKLPYVFAAEHPRLSDRAVVRQGIMLVQKPHILLPGHYGPEFAEGFEHAQSLPSKAVYLFRAMGLPYSKISNRPVAKEQIEFGSLQDVLNKFSRQLEALTGTIYVLQSIIYELQIHRKESYELRPSNSSSCE